jgi:hypothetical protein
MTIKDEDDQVIKDGQILRVPLMLMDSVQRQTARVDDNSRWPGIGQDMPSSQTRLEPNGSTDSGPLRPHSANVGEVHKLT